ncbi:P-loop containing nucleoside triphosphate hydrolase protein [Staphylotrichum tortipilum]|uniref:Replication factor C subunit 5 n=1 Tax=Staphylotrichum tortipilum TaxID=2831512 RepID=A0AAN6RT43_9PEZI|nr:P-loop containing nucleoside triphosphate hydrolase protein [Staphylotrichum longicolle]
MRPTTQSALLGAFQSLRISPATPLRAALPSASLLRPSAPTAPTTKTTTPQHARLFSATAIRAGSWLEPNLNRKNKMMKGRPRVPTGGSTKGTTVVWGDYGLRMRDHHRRISAAQLKCAEDTIKSRMRGQKYRLYKRVACNVGVFVSGNEMRMGKGKGSFDHWAARVAVNQIIFEIRGAVHEQVIRDAFRLAGNKLPGQYEFVRRGDPPVVGITKLDGVTLEELKKPWKQLPAEAVAEPPNQNHAHTIETNNHSTISPATPMALIVDKHRPKSLDALTYHEELSERLRSLAQHGDIPHILVYGPPGAGKKTRIVATLKELFGPGVEKIKIDARVFQTSSNRKLEFNIVSSVYHLEITPSDVGNYDRVVVQDLLKEVAQTQQVDQSARQKFKVVVINEADHLTRDAQAALRRTMEKYSPNLRLILLANSTANIIAPIRSRTLLVRVAAPTHEQICDVLAVSAKKEGWPVVKGLHQRIAEESGRNLRKALLMFEAVHAQNEKVTDTTPIPPPDWEALIGQIAKEILEEHTPARILQVRSKLYDLLTHCIPPTTILRTLTFKLIPQIDDALKADVIKWAAFFEHRIRTGTKVIFHLEAFVAKFMRILEMYLMSLDM